MKGPRIKPGTAVPGAGSSNPVPGMGRVSAETEALQAEASKALKNAIEAETAGLSAKTRLNLNAVVREHSSGTLSVFFPNISIMTLASAGIYWLKSTVESCLAAYSNKYPQAGLRLESILTNDDSKRFYNRAEIDAVAGLVGLTGDELSDAFERVRYLQSRGLPISLREQVKDEDKYNHRPNEAETVVGFLRRVWGPEMEADLLTRPYLRKHDKSAIDAIDNWLREQPLPPDIKVPTLKEVNDAKLRNKHRLRSAMQLVAAHGRRTVLPRP